VAEHHVLLAGPRRPVSIDGDLEIGPADPDQPRPDEDRAVGLGRLREVDEAGGVGMAGRDGDGAHPPIVATQDANRRKAQSVADAVPPNANAIPGPRHREATGPMNERRVPRNDH
jgi:hypothetical protein